eukprot:GHVH01001020.1.p1 GENE.GHVH01001020.1~~GHVH01001020.1.p1  ORF type:complete len:105 (+),score=7.36 GHVH01001020.1:79-393(+)
MFQYCCLCISDLDHFFLYDPKLHQSSGILHRLHQNDFLWSSIRFCLKTARNLSLNSFVINAFKHDLSNSLSRNVCASFAISECNISSCSFSSIAVTDFSVSSTS